MAADYDKCICKTLGEDDGEFTCWNHHDCFRGDCTHTDVDNHDQTNQEDLDEAI